MLHYITSNFQWNFSLKVSKKECDWLPLGLLKPVQKLFPKQLSSPKILLPSFFWGDKLLTPFSEETITESIQNYIMVFKNKRFPWWPPEGFWHYTYAFQSKSFMQKMKFFLLVVKSLWLGGSFWPKNINLGYSNQVGTSRSFTKCVVWLTDLLRFPLSYLAALGGVRV